MKKLFCTISLLLILISASFGQKPASFDYSNYWNKIEQLLVDRKPNEALILVDSIYFHAKKENQQGHFLKAVICQISLTNFSEETSFQKIIDKLDFEIKSSKEPQAQILHSYKAGILWSYYESNRYRILKRTTTINYKKGDVSTWDLRTLVEEVFKSYRMSLKNDQLLKSTKLDGFEQIIDTVEGSRKYRPTLYDLLIHRAIDFFMDDEPQIVKPGVTFYVNNPRYIGNAHDFTTMNITTPDSLSMKFYALQLLQEALKFHLNDTNAEALIDVDIKRLKYVRKNAIFENSDSLYIESLKELYQKHQQNPEVTSVLYQLAEFYYDEAKKYDTLINPKPQNYYLEAIKYAELAKKIFPKSDGTINCDQIKKSIISKSSLEIKTEEYSLPEVPSRILVECQNIKTLFLRVIPITNADYDTLMNDKYRSDSLFQKVSQLKYKSQSKILLPFPNDYQKRTMEVAIEALPIGNYVILGSDNENFNSSENLLTFSKITVTNLSYTERMLDNLSLEITVLNRKTGFPVKNAIVRVLREKKYYSNSTNSKSELIDYINGSTDQNGHCIFPYSEDSEYVSYTISTKKDQLQSKDEILDGLYGYDRSSTNSTFIFTDRAIYRPGQTIYFKGITINGDGSKSKVVVGEKTKITLREYNKDLSSVEVVTNEFGSFSGSFIAPMGFTGLLYIGKKGEYGSQSVQVEEYKRPKFEGTFKPITGSYRLNDKISVTGVAKAFAGNAIDGATVKYRIKRATYYHWGYWYYNNYMPEDEIDNGTVFTNSNGEFTIFFDAIPDKNIKQESPIFYYTITADITDINGETQTASTNIAIGSASMNIFFSIPQNLDQTNNNKFNIRTTNCSNVDEPALLSVKVYSLEQPAKIINSRYWKRPTSYLYSKEEFSKLFPNDEYSNELEKASWKRKETTYDKRINTATDSVFIFEDLRKWNRGEYYIEITGKDKYGEEFKKSQFFTLTNSSLTENSKYTHLSIQTNTQSADIDNSVEINMESSHPNSRVYLELFNDEKSIYHQWVKLTNNSKNIKVKIPKNHGTVSYGALLVSNNRIYTKEADILMAKNNHLDIKFATFRNKLNPGQEEEWQLTINGCDGEKVAAELMATMYDASLDSFKPHSFEFDTEYTNYTMLINRWNNEAFSEYSQYSNTYNPQKTNYNYAFISYERLFYNILLQRLYNNNPLSNLYMKTCYNRYENVDVCYCSPLIQKCSSRSAEGIASYHPLIETSGGETEPDMVSSSSNITEIKSVFTPVQIRKNFNETAFFMPQLATDADGNVVIKFKAPESLTRWKIMGLAHTKDLRFGGFIKELVTQKELMVVPNQPRFFREGDQMEFNAKISNISDKDLSGIAKIEFFDALTMKPINTELGLTTLEIPFSTLKGQSTSVAWKITIPQGLMAITYRVTAQAGNFSDGEEMTLPVLTNRMLVTESLPLPINGNQTKTFSFDKLKNNTSTTLKNFKYTLEFTSNPAWYAIQALPYLMEYPYECSEQTFNRFYANSIASHIANSSPKIKAVFESWKINSPEALMSNLEKNQELKSLMLEETPWVLDAKSETEQKKRIGLLFDFINMSSQLDATLNKLIKMQNPNGGWSWFPGMPGNQYITQYILAGFGHLNNLGAINTSSNSTIHIMIEKASLYSDAKIDRDYVDLINENFDTNRNHLNDMIIQYLYARSFFLKDIDLPPTAKTAFNYFLKQSKTYWTAFGIYEQAMIAIVNFKTGDQQTAKKIMASIKDRALYSEEMGMYWRNEGGGYYWYEAPIERQALLIEAFDLITNDQESVEKMKIWLLKQKQTQNWGTTKSTAEACYALLLKGTSQLADDQLVEIKIGDKVIDPKKMDNVKVEAGTGYFKTAWNGTEITPDMGNITVTKSTNGVAWGSVYWQYFENLDKITPATTPLSMKKELFIVRATPTGEVIELVKAGDKIKVGDKIRVRIVLRSDRDMEYVHMKDMRAAAFEPINVLSQYKYQDGLGYYESTRDAATNFFFDYLRKGTYVFEYTMFATQKGDFSNGITTIQCMYAPEFSSHSEGIRVVVE